MNNKDWTCTWLPYFNFGGGKAAGYILYRISYYEVAIELINESFPFLVQLSIGEIKLVSTEEPQFLYGIPGKYILKLDLILQNMTTNVHKLFINSS